MGHLPNRGAPGRLAPCLEGIGKVWGGLDAKRAGRRGQDRGAPALPTVNPR